MTEEPAFCQHPVSLRMNAGLDVHRSRFTAIELEGREEVYVFERFHLPSGKQVQSSFPKCLDAHHAGQHRGAVNLMIMKKRLTVRIQSRLEGVTIRQAE